MNPALADIYAAAKALVDARQRCAGMDSFPGKIPDTLDLAYRMQAEAVRLAGKDVAGWKVGRISGTEEVRFGVNRFIGPILAGTIFSFSQGSAAPFPAISGGSSALEAELIAVLTRDVPPTRQDWLAAEVKDLLSSLHVGIEIAGSPIPEISALGPLASIAAFGNNFGLIVGPAIPDWRDIDIERIACGVTVDRAPVGHTSAKALPGGPYEAIAFALNRAAQLGAPLRAGSWISTGAITGVHPVTIGQTCVADFGVLGALTCSVVRARAT